MSQPLERQVEQLIARVRDLERELVTLRGASDQVRRGFAEVALAAAETGDAIPDALGAVTSGTQLIDAGEASILEIVDDAGTLKLKPIQNAAGANKAKLTYLNAAGSQPQLWTDAAEPMLLVRLRDGRWVRFPAAGAKARVYLTPEGGITARTGSAGTWTPGTATCTLCHYSGTDLLTSMTTDTLYNISDKDVQGDSLVIAVDVDGRWTVGASGSSTAFTLFTLTSDLAATVGATATATDGTNSFIVVNSGEFRAFTGATGLAVILEDGTYWIIFVNQPALRARVVLDVHPDNDTASEDTRRFGADPRSANAAIKTGSINVPVALTPFPFSFLPDLSSGLVPNPHQLFGENGDKAILAWDKNTGGYFLEEVFPQRQQELWATLSVDRPDGLAQAMTADPMTPAGDGTLPSAGFAVDDTYNVAIHGKAEDRILAKWDAFAGKYKAIAAEHTARRVSGYVSSDFDNYQTTFDVTVTAAMDGKNPGASITVVNRYNWEFAKSGDVIEVLWDTVEGEWYPEQLEGPEDPVPTFIS